MKTIILHEETVYDNLILTSTVIDYDVENRKMAGLLGIKGYVDPPMKIEY